MLIITKKSCAQLSGLASKLYSLITLLKIKVNSKFQGNQLRKHSKLGDSTQCFAVLKACTFILKYGKCPKLSQCCLLLSTIIFFFSMELHIYYSYHKCLLTWLALLLPHFIFWSNHPTKYEILLSFCGNRFPVHASG